MVIALPQNDSIKKILDFKVKQKLETQSLGMTVATEKAKSPNSGFAL
jgi:hypothetical protein